MKTSLASASNCRHCRYYAHQGRRGGQCHQLNVDVQSGWKACALAVPAFSPDWENLEGIMVWQQKALAALQASTQLDTTEVEVTVAAVEAALPLSPSSNSVVSARALRV